MPAIVIWHVFCPIWSARRHAIACRVQRVAHNPPRQASQARLHLCTTCGRLSVRRAWCILVLLAATLLPVAAAFPDVQTIPLEPDCARAAQEGVSAWEKGIMTHPRTIAQSLPALTGLSVTASVVSPPLPSPR